jgi:CRISPR-associated protein Cas2
MRVVIAYDVSDDDRRARVAAACSRHGIRLQRSVFDCDLPADEFEALSEALSTLIDPATDVVHVLLQCATCLDGRHSAGRVVTTLDEAFWVL